MGFWGQGLLLSEGYLSAFPLTYKSVHVILRCLREFTIMEKVAGLVWKRVQVFFNVQDVYLDLHHSKAKLETLSIIILSKLILCKTHLVFITFKFLKNII